MANLVESANWELGIYQLETSDPVEGGPNGIDNLQAKQLGNRTLKIKDTLDKYGIFINSDDEDFVGQPVVLDAVFEGTVVDGDVVYYDIANVRFAKALSDGTEKANAFGIADVTNSKIITFGLIQTTRTDTVGDILFLSDTVAGALTTTDTGTPVARYEYNGIISLNPAASAGAISSSIAPGSITPDKLSETYYPDTYLDPKIINWDSAYTERRQWNGSATNLVPATARTSLGLTGDVSTHSHDTMYYTKSYLDPKIINWDIAYDEKRYWDGSASGLDASLGRTSLGLIGDISTHIHDSLYYTKSLINAKCGNWDTAYTERRQWSGSASNLDANAGRIALGLTGSVVTHNHNTLYTNSKTSSYWFRKTPDSFATYIVYSYVIAPQTWTWISFLGASFTYAHTAFFTCHNGITQMGYRNLSNTQVEVWNQYGNYFTMLVIGQ